MHTESGIALSDWLLRGSTKNNKLKISRSLCHWQREANRKNKRFPCAHTPHSIMSAHQYASIVILPVQILALRSSQYGKLDRVSSLIVVGRSKPAPNASNGNLCLSVASLSASSDESLSQQQPNRMSSAESATVRPGYQRSGVSPQCPC